jgi:hypothetical protein
MIIPSSLNPIYIFQPDEPVFWLNNFYGADRGGYVRRWFTGQHFKIYFRSTTVGANVVTSVYRCKDRSSLTVLPAPVLISGDYYYVDVMLITPINELTENYYIIIRENVNTTMITSGLSGLAVSDAIISGNTGYGVRFVLPRSYNPEFVDLQVGVSVAQISPTDVYWYKVDPANPINKQLLAQSTITIVGTGIIFLNIPVPAAAIVSWSKGDVLAMTMFARGADVFSIPFGISYTDNLVRTNSCLVFEDGGSRVSPAPSTEAIEPIVYYFANTNLRGWEAVYSELTRWGSTQSPITTSQTLVSYSNKKLYQGIQANQSIRTYWPISFWKKNNPQVFEDIEIVPGEFTRLRNELNSETMMETDYLPAYMHKQIQLAVACDNIVVDSVEQIQRAEYNFDYSNNHYALSKGQLRLTEKKTIQRNII